MFAGLLMYSGINLLAVAGGQGLIGIVVEVALLVLALAIVDGGVIAFVGRWLIVAAVGAIVSAIVWAAVVARAVVMHPVMAGGAVLHPVLRNRIRLQPYEQYAGNEQVFHHCGIIK